MKNAFTSNDNKTVCACLCSLTEIKCLQSIGSLQLSCTSVRIRDGYLKTSTRKNEREGAGLVFQALRELNQMSRHENFKILDSS